MALNENDKYFVILILRVQEIEDKKLQKKLDKQYTPYHLPLIEKLVTLLGGIVEKRMIDSDATTLLISQELFDKNYQKMSFSIQS